MQDKYFSTPDRLILIINFSPKLGNNNFGHFCISYGIADYKGESANASLQLGIHQGDKTTLVDADAGDITNLCV